MSNKVTKKKNTGIADLVMGRVNDRVGQGNLQLPTGYSPQNALMDAQLQLQDMTVNTRDGTKPVLDVVTTASVANALFKMVTQGLNPAKGQCYFIPYGNKLEMQKSYLGSVALAKQSGQVDDIKGYPVYEQDDFKLGFDVTTGRQTLEEYNPSTTRVARDLIGAFAIAIKDGGVIHTEYMTMEQIRQAWNQGQMKGNSSAHKNFPDQMAIKTVINRAAKHYIGTSDDEGLDLSNSMAEADYEVDAEIEENAHTEVLEEVDYTVLEDEEIDQETGEIIPEEPEPEEATEPETKPPF